MIRRIRVLFEALLVVSILSVYGAAQCSDANRKALEKLDRDWGDATGRAALEKYYASDYEGVGLLSTSSREQALQGADDPVDPNAPKNSYDTYVITCTPMTATVTHRVVTVSEKDGKKSTSYFRAIHFAEKRDGRWQFVSSTGHPMNDEGVIIYKEIDGYHAYMNRDTEWMERNTSASYIGVGMQGNVVSKSQSIENMKNDKNKYESVKLSNVRVQVNGDVGVITGVYDISGKDPAGNPISMKMRFSRTLKRDNGDWIAVASTGIRIDQPEVAVN